MSEIFKANTDPNIRIRFLKVYLWNIALYRYESWTIDENERENIEAFEIYCYRRIH